MAQNMSSAAAPASIRRRRSANDSGGATRLERMVPYALWTAQVLLAILFVYAGASKWVMSEESLTKDIDLSVPFLRFIGACEVLGGIGLVLPGVMRMWRGLTPLAAIGLVIIMIGAVAVTVPTMGVAAALFPLVVGLVLAFVAYQRRSWFTA